MEHIAITTLIGVFIFLHVRGFRDGAFSDPLLFLMGISLVYYVVTRPKRTRVPVAVAISAVLLYVASPYLRTPSAEQVAQQNLHEGEDAYLTDDFGRAIAFFSKAIELDPDSPEARCGRGLAYFRVQEYERAVADFTQALELKPTFVEAYCGRGGAFFEMGEDDKAILDFTEAIRIDPEDFESFHNRGLAYHFMGDQNRALADFDTCRELGGDVDPELLNDVREALDDQDEPSE